MCDNVKSNQNQQLSSNFFTLPNDVTQSILLPYFDAKTKHALVQTCRRAYAFFQQNLFELGVEQALLYVLGSEKKEIEKMKIDPRVFLARGKICDYSFREFPFISPIELAAWSFDTDVLSILLNKLPEIYWCEALQQLQQLEERGISYYFCDPETKILETYTENHYDFSRLIDALQDYIENFSNWTYRECKNYWEQLIRAQQRLVPVHLADKMCRSFLENFFMSACSKETVKKITLSWFSSKKVVPGLGARGAVSITIKDILFSLASPFFSFVGIVLLSLMSLLMFIIGPEIAILLIPILIALILIPLGGAREIMNSQSSIPSLYEVGHNKECLENYCDKKISGFSKLREEFEKKVIRKHLHEEKRPLLAAPGF